VSIRVQLNERDKWGIAKSGYISVETALELYEGGLYTLLQKEYAYIQEQIERNKDNIKAGQALLKRYETAGIKAPKEVTL